MDTYSFTVHIRAKDIYIDIAKDVETRFNTSNYEFERPLQKKKYEKNSINGKWIRQKKNDRACCIEKNSI